MDFSASSRAYADRVEAGIDRLLPKADVRPERLHEAMRYSMQAGGKRLRPMLVLAACELFAERSSWLDPMPAAVAVECVHTYSLIHDDLPCMDNDDLRRGRPTAHKAFDEATALLAGDSLLTYAFELLGGSYPGETGLGLVAVLATAAGSRRLIGGQVADLQAEKKADATASDLEFIHLNKTAAMIEASLVMGGLVGLAGRKADGEIAGLKRGGRDLGFAFQIIDDILDATADTATLGKTAGKDAKSGKTTFVSLHGLEKSREMASEHTARAISAFRQLPGDTAFLIALAESMAKRLH